MGKFVSTVLADTEDVWKELPTKGGATYKELRLFCSGTKPAREAAARGKQQWPRFTARLTKNLYQPGVSRNADQTPGHAG